MTSLREQLSATYRDRSVLVTGHTGFKGGWLCRMLQQLGARTTGFALAPEPGPSLFESASVGADCVSVFGDLRDRAALQAVVAASRPEYVFHLAAQPLVLRSYEDPVETYATNVLGTAHLLEELRKTPSLRAAVVVTSDKVYDNREHLWPYRETDPLGGKDPYSASKACCELIVASYRHAFFKGGVGVATARAGNVIGGGDFSANRLLPDIVRAAEQGRKVQLRNPHAERPWQHVLEPLAGYLQLGVALSQRPSEVADAWNFGPDDDGHSVMRVASRFTELLGASGVEVLAAEAEQHEAQLLRVDATKARKRLGFRSQFDLEAALQATALWYRAHLDGRAVDGLTDTQVRTYLDADLAQAQ